MLDTRTISACLLAAAVTSLAIILLRRLAVPLGLMDDPDERKHHVGSVPLVGGLAMYLGLLAGTAYLGVFHRFGICLLATSAVLTLLGMLDDRHDLSVRTRLWVQVLTILVMMIATGTQVRMLGPFLGHELALGWLGVPFTIIAVIGLLNAFNMLDGIDGLAGTLALISVVAILLFLGKGQRHTAFALLSVLVATVLPYLIANLGWAGQKIFMGDAGSMLIGYMLAWLLIRLSQDGPSPPLATADVLWCVALPVLDTLAVMYRRIRQGKSPFKPDRGHIHHLLLGFKLSARMTLLCLGLLAAALAFLGTLLHRLGNTVSLLAFVILLTGYVSGVSSLWKRLEAKPRSGVLPSRAANDAIVGSALEIQTSSPGEPTPLSPSDTANPIK